MAVPPRLRPPKISLPNTTLEITLAMATSTLAHTYTLVQYVRPCDCQLCSLFHKYISFQTFIHSPRMICVPFSSTILVRRGARGHGAGAKKKKRKVNCKSLSGVFHTGSGVYLRVYWLAAEQNLACFFNGLRTTSDTPTEARPTDRLHDRPLAVVVTLLWVGGPCALHSFSLLFM